MLSVALLRAVFVLVGGGLFWFLFCFLVTLTSDALSTLTTKPLPCFFSLLEHSMLLLTLTTCLALISPSSTQFLVPSGSPATHPCLYSGSTMTVSSRRQRPNELSRETGTIA